MDSKVTPSYYVDGDAHVRFTALRGKFFDQEFVVGGNAYVAHSTINNSRVIGDAHVISSGLYGTSVVTGIDGHVVLENVHAEKCIIEGGVQLKAEIHTMMWLEYLYMWMDVP